MLDWLRGQAKPPHHTFVVHGEPEAADTLRLRIADELGWRVRVPQHGETVSV
jgi:metallo-beta-lactamase family protein